MKPSPGVSPVEQKCRGAGRVSLLTGGFDPHYAIPLAAALARQPCPFQLEVIGSDEFLASPELRHPQITLLNLHGNTGPKKPLHQKILRVVGTYLRLCKYAAHTDSCVFHILWHNRFDWLDRTLLTAFYRSLGKKLVYTAHNVDADERDGRRGLLRRSSLQLMYRMIDHIFVHTEKMKERLEREFMVDRRRITVIPFGMNTVAPSSAVTRAEARHRLGLGDTDKIALFFGNIAPYKGLEYLIHALAILKAKGVNDVNVIVAGNVKGSRSRPYWDEIVALIEEYRLQDRVRTEIRFIPEQDVELFFKSADVCVLPYRHIDQTGLLCLSHRYGVPVIATDVGSMKEDIIEGRTGFVCRASDPEDLARAIEAYFRGQLFADRDHAREDIARFAETRYSWDPIVAAMSAIYKTLLPASADSLAQNV